MMSSKYWIIGTALMFAAFTACSSNNTRSDDSAVTTTPAVETSSATAVNTGKNTMEKGAAKKTDNKINH